MPKNQLPLKKARELNQLENFISQEKKRGSSSATSKRFNRTLISPLPIFSKNHIFEEMQ